MFPYFYLIFSGNIFSTTLVFPILKLSKKILNIVIIRKFFSFFLAISATKNFTFGIGNSRVVENIFLPKISYGKEKFYYSLNLNQSKSTDYL